MKTLIKKSPSDDPVFQFMNKNGKVLESLATLDALE